MVTERYAGTFPNQSSRQKRKIYMEQSDIRPRVTTRMGWTVMSNEDRTGGHIIPGTTEESIPVIDGLRGANFADVRRDILNATAWGELV